MSGATRRAALVTGGTGCIGRAVVAALAAGGWDVAVHCHAALPAAREIAAGLGGASLAVTADLRDEAAVRALVHRVVDHFGRLDAVVHCAGRRTASAFDDATAADLHSHFDVAVAGGFVVVQEAAAALAGGESGGAVVIVAAASHAPGPGEAAFTASQMSLVGLARALDAEFAARRPRVRVALIDTIGATAGGVAAEVAAFVAG